jgi:hypothetical protein
MMEFSEWFAANKARLEPLLQSDAEEALYEAYMAGAVYRSNSLATALAATPVEPWEDRMGGQFTQEEIRRGDRGWEGR